ncbi:hypothetical protein HK405_005422 [Cladochytrium tenue]|nr:hypothetical protein HK405_005422 [Cladochytrium tenue]
MSEQQQQQQPPRRHNRGLEVSLGGARNELAAGVSALACALAGVPPRLYAYNRPLAATVAAAAAAAAAALDEHGKDNDDDDDGGGGETAIAKEAALSRAAVVLAAAWRAVWARRGPLARRLRHPADTGSPPALEAAEFALQRAHLFGRLATAAGAGTAATRGSVREAGGAHRHGWLPHPHLSAGQWRRRKQHREVDERARRERAMAAATTIARRHLLDALLRDADGPQKPLASLRRAVDAAVATARAEEHVRSGAAGTTGQVDWLAVRDRLRREFWVPSAGTSDSGGGTHRGFAKNRERAGEWPARPRRDSCDMRDT